MYKADGLPGLKWSHNLSKGEDLQQRKGEPELLFHCKDQPPKFLKIKYINKMTNTKLWTILKTQIPHGCYPKKSKAVQRFVRPVIKGNHLLETIGQIVGNGIPNVPMIWNFEAIWHEVNGNSEKSNEIVEQTLQKFPDYLYAITHKAILLMGKNSLRRRNPSGRRIGYFGLYPERKAFHYSECGGLMQQAAIEYLAGTADWELKNIMINWEMKIWKDFITGNKNRIEYYRRKKFNEERKN